MIVSIIFIISFLLIPTKIVAEIEIYSVTNFLLAFGIISICSRLDDLKRK